MGSACTKGGQQQVQNPMSYQDQMVNHEFAPILSISHPFNVNKKYDTVSEIQRDQYSGTGIKRTHAYKTSLTKEEIERKRFEFWDSRTEGHAQNWLVLKQACQVDEVQALALLQAAGIKLVNKSIQIAFDSDACSQASSPHALYVTPPELMDGCRWFKYDIPIFCINEPIAYAEVSKLEKLLIQNYTVQQVEFKLRVVGIEKDIIMNCSTSTTIEEFKGIVMTQINTKWKRFRLFIAGREMLPHHHLGNYKLTKETIVQAFVTNAE